MAGNVNLWGDIREYLIANGPSTVSEIASSFPPGMKDSIRNTLTYMEEQGGFVRKVGRQGSAIVWDYCGYDGKKEVFDRREHPGYARMGRYVVHEVKGDRATCMDFLYPADEYQIDDFSKKVPCPPKSVPPTTPKRSSNTKSSRDAIGRELDRLAKGDPGYATAAKDPEVRKWVRDYYGYLEDTFHGNQGSPGEIVGGGFIIDFIAGSEGADTEERIRDVLDVDYGGEGAEIYSRLDTLRPKVGRMLGSANRKPKASRPKTATKSLPSTKRSTKPKTATRRGKR